MLINRNNVLWESFRRGDESAFESLFKSVYNTLYSYGFTLSSDEKLIKESIHDLFLYLWEKKAQLKEVKAVEAYLFVSFKRLLLKKIQAKRKNNQQHFQLEDIDASQLSTPSIESYIIQNETRNHNTSALQNALNSLSPLQRQIIHLRYEGKMKPIEIAEVLGIKYQTVRNYWSKAIKKLRKKMLEEAFGKQNRA